MKYCIYKLKFPMGVHFGRGMLNDSDISFRADTLFSALYIEALKVERAQELYQAVSSRTLCISDSFPFIEDEYMLPKPMLYVEPSNRGNSEEKKKYKKLKYIPVSCFEEYVQGKWNMDHDPMKHFGEASQETRVYVRNEELTEPYRVGTFSYYEGNGLYVIVGYEDEQALQLFEVLMKNLSYVGIGGKRSGGLGRFELYKGNCKCLVEMLNKQSDCNMLLSTALPREDELEDALKGSSYQLIRRSGFAAPSKDNTQMRKKKDLYVFAAGSCFTNVFDGDIYDVSNGDECPVFRYAKPMFLGVSR